MTTIAVDSYLANMDNPLPKEILVAGKWHIVQGSRGHVKDGKVQKRTHLTTNKGTISVQYIRAYR